MSQWHTHTHTHTHTHMFSCNSRLGLRDWGRLWSRSGLMQLRILTAYEQDEPQRSVDSSPSRDSIRGLPLPPSCLLPLGHTAVHRCQPERVFSQIANANYSLGNFLFLSVSRILTCGFIFVFWSLVSLPPPQLSLPLADVDPRGQFSLCASCVAAESPRQRRLISHKEGVAWLMKSLRWGKRRTSLSFQLKVRGLWKKTLNTRDNSSEFKSFNHTLQTKSPSHQMHKTVFALNALHYTSLQSTNVCTSFS